MKQETSTRLGYLPTINGIRFEPLGHNPDYEKLAGLINAALHADEILNSASASELDNFYSHLPHFDPERDSLLAWAGDRLVAENYIIRSQELNGPYVYAHHALVRKEWRSALIEPLVEWVEHRIVEIDSQSDSPGERLARAFLGKTEVELRAEIERRGYEIERYFYIMARPHLDDIPKTSLAPGLEIRPVRAKDIRTIWDANGEAFKEHWGHRERTEEDFERFRNDPLQDPSLWKVAWDGDRVAGMVLNFIDHDENRQLNRLRGYTEDIAVLPPYRRKGLATHLIAESLRLLQEVGMNEAALGVDVANANGALGLYEQMGYQKLRETYAYRQSIDDLRARLA